MICDFGLGNADMECPTEIFNKCQSTCNQYPELE